MSERVGRLVAIPLGVGDAFSAKWYSSAFAVGALSHDGEENWILIDCPHPIRKMLAEADAAQAIGLDIPNIDGVVLTHLHGDHASGLEAYGFFHHFALQTRAKVLAHPSVTRRLWPDHLAAGMDHLLEATGGTKEMEAADYFESIDLSPTKTVTFGPFQIECRMTVHHVPTTALRLRAYGRTLAFSADTAFDPALIAWLDEGSDVIFHETNLGAHTPYEKLAALDERLREKMRLYHFPDFFDVEGSVIRCLKPGERVEI